MKNFNLLIRSLMWMPLILIFIQCEENEDKKDDDDYNILFGNHTIEGVILYRDARTNVLDTAGGAFVQLKMNEANSTKFKARDDLSLVAKGGRFKFTQLPGAKYKLDISYLNQSISYIRKKDIDTDDPAEIEGAKTIELEINNAVDYGVASLSGIVKVDEDGEDTTEAIPASNAQLTLTGPKDAPLGEAKVITQTNDDGKFKFEKLNAGKYTLEVSFQQQKNNTILTYKYKSENDVTIDINADDTIDAIILKEKTSGQASIHFSVKFKDITTDLYRVASGANIEVQFANTIMNYTTDANGKFKIDKPNEEKYIITASLQQEIGGQFVRYEEKDESKEISIQENQSEYKINLCLDEESLINPLLRIKVLNKDNIRVANASVFLYGSEDARKKDTERIAAIAKGTSNERGIVLFSNIDKRNYYLFSQAINGNDTINAKKMINWGDNKEYFEFPINLK